MTENLTEKQKKFCEEYIIDFNATQAAIRAGYSEKTAKVIANENLTKPYIQIYIQCIIKKREQRTEITADMVVKELAKVAFLSVDEFMNDDGEIKRLYELSENAKGALSSYGVKRVKMGDDFIDVPIFKMNDKIKSLELLGKHLGMFDRTIKIEEETKSDTPMQITIIRDI